MGQLIHFPPMRSVGSSPTIDRAPLGGDASDVDTALWPVAALLFVASALRVAHALLRHEAFDTEPTMALVFVVGLPWLALRSRRKTLRNAASAS